LCRFMPLSPSDFLSGMFWPKPEPVKRSATAVELYHAKKRAAKSRF